jgi:hypothetical protein
MPVTEPRDYDKVFQWILDILRAKRKPSEAIEKSMATAIESQKSFLYAEFASNTKAQGTIVGLGKEPDVPRENMVKYISSVGYGHRKQLGLRPIICFIVSEEKKGEDWYVYITGGHQPEKLIMEPHLETYRLKVIRGSDKMIKKVDSETKEELLDTHVSFIKTYFKQ